MKISEIKKCFDNKKSICCVEAFWEDTPFYEALSHNQSQPSAENVYDIIRRVFLENLGKEVQTPEEKKENRRRKRDLKSLSKHLYGDDNYWAIGTQWEHSQQCLRKINMQLENYRNLSFLYERLSLAHIGHRRDLVYKIAHAQPFYEAVMNREQCSSIENVQELYDCMENEMLNIWGTTDWKYHYLHIMNSISYIAYHDKGYWIRKNNLIIEQISNQA